MPKSPAPRHSAIVILIATALSMPGCANPAGPRNQPVSAPDPADTFLATLARRCGQAFAGRIVADRPSSPTPGPFTGKTLVMHVRGCTEPWRELRIPFHVGDDHSRTWVLTAPMPACA